MIGIFASGVLFVIFVIIWNKVEKFRGWKPLSSYMKEPMADNICTPADGVTLYVMAGPSLQLCTLCRCWYDPCTAFCQAGRARWFRYAKDWFLGSLELATLLLWGFFFCFLFFVCVVVFCFLGIFFDEKK